MNSTNQIVQVCRLLYENGWLAACDGNVSMRLDENTILITPSARHKGFLEADEIVTMNFQGEARTGTPSSEYPMHLEVYRQCPQAKAVIHAHPPVATAWSIAKPYMKELPNSALSEVILAVGKIPIVPYARPGSEELGEKLKPFLPSSRVMVLSRHGSLCWGETLDEAFFGTERLEHVARTLMYAQTISGLSELPYMEIRELKKMRNAKGDRIL